LHLLGANPGNLPGQAPTNLIVAPINPVGGAADHRLSWSGCLVLADIVAKVILHW
jgi:hypothetical protein